MKKTGLSLLLSLALVITCLPCVSFANDENSLEGKTFVYFGQYPQSLVTDENVINKLSNIDFTDNVGQLNGVKYYYKNKNYYRFESIEWLVLKESEGVYTLLSNRVLDNHAFNWELFWTDSGSIRDWLNSDFYDIAFSGVEQEAILNTTNQTYYYPYNDAYIDNKDPQYVVTQEKVFLLDKEEAMDSAYGFDSTESESDSRIGYYTQFCDTSESAAKWWLRGNARWYYGNLQQQYVTSAGGFSTYYGTYSYGVRPAIRVSTDATSDDPLPIEEESDNFVLGEDNNSFYHFVSSDPSSGFYGIDKHSLSLKYKDILLNQTGITDRLTLLILWSAENNWHGSCFGIAATIALKKMGLLSASDISDSDDGTSFFNLRKPCLDHKFFNTIEYYYYQQDVKTVVDKATLSDTDNDSNSDFFNKFIAELDKGKYLVLCTPGHSVVATGYTYEPKNNRYIFDIYDINSVYDDSPKGSMTHLFVSDDFSYYVFKGSSNPNMYGLTLIDPTLLLDMDGHSFNADDIINIDGSTINVNITVNKNSKITISSSLGKSLILGPTLTTVSNELELLGKKVLSNDVVGEENGDITCTLTLPANDIYTISSDSETIQCVVGNDISSIAVSGHNIGSIEIDPSKYAIIDGNSQYDFSAYTLSKDNTAFELSAKAEAGKRSVFMIDGSDKVTLNSEGPLTSIASKIIGAEDTTLLNSEINLPSGSTFAEEINSGSYEIQNKDDSSNTDSNPQPTMTGDTNVAETNTEATQIMSGETFKYKGAAYVVLNSEALTVALTKAKNVKSFTLPSTVNYKDKIFKVVQLNSKAFTGKKIRTVIIGKNVKKVQKNAFKGSKAAKLVVKTKLFKKSGVKGALKGSAIKTIQVKVGKKSDNKKYVKLYKKIFTKANAGRKVTLK